MTETVTYVMADPTGNLTILVETAVPVDRQPSVAAALMTREPAAEQVGFVGDDAECDIALRMAGGEFCGNAAMSAAILAARRSCLSKGAVTVRVSGAKEPVAVEVGSQEDGVRRARVAMPRPLDITEKDLPGAGPLPVVRFDGISHVIRGGEPSRGEAQALAADWSRILRADALGILYYEPTESRMTPLVYVPGAGTMCWERSCASGTAALGAWLARRSGGSVRAALRQPGGVLTIEADASGSLLLSGAVRLLRRSVAEVRS